MIHLSIILPFIHLHLSMIHIASHDPSIHHDPLIHLSMIHLSIHLHSVHQSIYIHPSTIHLTSHAPSTHPWSFIHLSMIHLFIHPLMIYLPIHYPSIHSFFFLLKYFWPESYYDLTLPHVYIMHFDNFACSLPPLIHPLYWSLSFPLPISHFLKNLDSV